MKHIAFTLPGLGISGGTHIILKWAHILAAHGHTVKIVVPQDQRARPIPFLRPEDINFTVLTLDEATTCHFDIAFASWWETIPLLTRLTAKTYALFVQALESQFYPAGAIEQSYSELFLHSDLPIVTIAGWLRSHLVDVLGIPATRVVRARNPLDKAMWRPVPALVPKSSRLRFIIEGPSTDPRKNIPETLALVKKCDVEYVWVGSLVDQSLAGRRCVRVIQGARFQDMPAIYSSGDVLIKLSTAEGMFGPPLEMFACGGTALVWDVWGAEEYLVHRENCLMAPMHSLAQAEAGIRELVARPELVMTLKRAAVETARRWPDWSEVAPDILAVIDQLPASTDSARLMRHTVDYLVHRPLPARVALKHALEAVKVRGNRIVRALLAPDRTVRPPYRRAKQLIKRAIRGANA